MAALCARSFSHAVSTWRHPGVLAVSLQWLMVGADVSPAPSINHDGKNHHAALSAKVGAFFPSSLSHFPSVRTKVTFLLVSAPVSARDSSVFGPC